MTDPQPLTKDKQQYDILRHEINYLKKDVASAVSYAKQEIAKEYTKKEEIFIANQELQDLGVDTSTKRITKSYPCKDTIMDILDRSFSNVVCKSREDDISE